MDTFRMDRNYEGHHDDAWHGSPADGNVCNTCDDMKYNDCQRSSHLLCLRSICCHSVLMTDMNWGQLHVTSSGEKRPDLGGHVRVKISFHAKIYIQATSHIDSIFLSFSARVLRASQAKRSAACHGPRVSHRPGAQHNVQHQMIHLPSVARGSILPFIPCS
jgi:hypothetical protein